MIRPSAPSTPSDRRPAARRRGEAGYNLIILVMVIAVMNVMLAAALPAFTATIRRDKEEEMVFRGLQYAEAIRVFQNRFQRPPVRLDELIEAKPRCIRQLWKDPMTEDGKWALIFQGQQNEMPLVPGQPDPQDGKPGDKPDEGEPDETTGSTPKPGDVVATGPIIGVRSKSKKASFLMFNGQQRYDQWRFTVDLVAGGSRMVQSGGAAVPLAHMIPNLSSRWIGRPFDQSLVPPGMGTPDPQQQMPGGNKPRPTTFPSASQ